MRGEQGRDLVRVEITRLRKTGMYLGTSPGLRGLFVHGRTVDELESRVPEAIRSLMEAKGCREVEVTRMGDGTDDTTNVLTVRRYQLTFSREPVLH